MSIHSKLMTIRSTVKSAKDERNNFGGYAYRNVERMLATVNPICADNGITLSYSDQIVMVGARYYLQTTLTAWDVENGENYAVTAMAREQESKKGMDEAQITGSAATYAHKYALMSMLAISDPAADPDSMDNRAEGNRQPAQQTWQAQPMMTPPMPAQTIPPMPAQTIPPMPAEQPVARRVAGWQPQRNDTPAQPMMTPPPMPESMPTPPPIGVPAPESDQKWAELPDGDYGGHLVDLYEMTTARGGRGVKVVFTTPQGQLSQYVAHGYGRVGNLIKSLGYDGDEHDIAGALAACKGKIYHISKHRSRDDRYYDLDVKPVSPMV